MLIVFMIGFGLQTATLAANGQNILKPGYNLVDRGTKIS